MWYYHLAISTLFTAVRFLTTSRLSCLNVLYECMAICGTTLLFGFVERAMKETWILYDSFKRAQKVYTKLVDAALLPTFVTDSTGRVLYANSRGKALFVESRPNAEDKDRSQQRLQRGGANLLELVHPDSLKPVEALLKRGPRDRAPPLDVPLLCRQAEEAPAAELEGRKEDPGLDLTIFARGKGTELLVGFEHYRLTGERVAWKAANCVLVSCENTTQHKVLHQKLIRHGLQLRRQLLTNCGTLGPHWADKLEKELLASKKKEQDALALLEAKRLFYLNELSIFSSTESIGAKAVQAESFNLQALLDYFMDLLSARAMPKASALTLSTEPSFPKEVSSDKTKLEIVLVFLIMYFIDHSEATEIRVEAKMKSAYKDGYCVAFAFGSVKSDGLNLEVLRTVFAPPPEGAPPIVQRSPTKEEETPLYECKKLVTYLKGTTDVTDEGFFKVHVELTVGHPENFDSNSNAKKLSIYQAEKAGEYITRWVPKRPLLADMGTEGKLQDSAGLPKSPALNYTKLSEGTNSKLKRAMEQAKNKNAALQSLKKYAGDNVSPSQFSNLNLQQDSSKKESKSRGYSLASFDQAAEKDKGPLALEPEEADPNPTADPFKQPKLDDVRSAKPDSLQPDPEPKTAQCAPSVGVIASPAEDPPKGVLDPGESPPAPIETIAEVKPEPGRVDCGVAV